MENFTLSERSIVSFYPELAQQWSNLNNEKEVTKVKPNSSLKAWWQCEFGHTWEAVVSNRVQSIQKTGKLSTCPVCDFRVTTEVTCLSATHPALSAELHPTRNKSFSSSEITHRDGRKAWWRCSKGHEWEAAINRRSRVSPGRKKASGCPYCTGRLIAANTCLSYTHPHLVNEWDFATNGSKTPETVTAGSQYEAGWVCAKGHRYKFRIQRRAEGQGLCKQRHSLAGSFPELLSEWNFDQNDMHDPYEIHHGSAIKVWWNGRCGHTWEALFIRVHNEVLAVLFVVGE
jgi:hypothetical protein